MVNCYLPAMDKIRIPAYMNYFQGAGKTSVTVLAMGVDIGNVA